MTFEKSVRRAGFTGDGVALGESLFEGIVAGHSGVTFTVDEWDEQWSRIATSDGLIHLAIPELLTELSELASEPPITNDEYPFVLSAGERRSFTANTIIRDTSWRKRDPAGALRLSPLDAERVGVADGAMVRVVTARGSAEVSVEVNTAMHEGHISLPNGMGLDEPTDSGLFRTGASPNDLTASGDRDWIAGTPWHKSVPARLEPVGS